MISEPLAEIKSAIKHLAEEVGKLTLAKAVSDGQAAGVAQASKPKWWAEPVLVAVLSTLGALAVGIAVHYYDAAHPAPPSAHVAP